MNVLSQDFLSAYNESDIRTNIISWYDFKPAESLCYAGNIGAPLEAYLKDKLFVVDRIENLSQDKYDYCLIFNAGVDEFFDPLDAELLSKADTVLKPDGRIFISLYNKLGTKFISGGIDDISGQRDTYFLGKSEDRFIKSYSKKDVIKALNDIGFVSEMIYYPLPDHIFPVSIFSDEFLPELGDIRGASTSYSDGGTYNLDESLLLDKLCADGIFGDLANSLLFVVKRENCELKGTTTVIHAKYNQSRNKAFQTRTVLDKDSSGQVLTYKQPMSECSHSYVDSLKDKFKLTKNIYPNIEFEECQIKEERVYMPYISGHSLDEEIAPLVKSGPELVSKIKEILLKYYQPEDSHLTEFEVSDQFKEIFKNIDCIGMQCLRPVNLDVILDNVIVGEDGQARGFDYEWTYDITVPVKYITYRILSRIYDKYLDVISSYIDFYDFITLFEIDENERKIFSLMERSFINMVYGENQYEKFRNNIEKGREPLDKIIAERNSLKNECLSLKEKNDSLQNELNTVYSSRTWRAGKRIGGASKLAKKLKNEGMGAAFSSLHNKLARIPFDFDISTDKEELKQQSSYIFVTSPKISIVTPLFNTPEKYLVELLDSFEAQTYKNIELCLVDFSEKKNKWVGKIVKNYASHDSRIKYRRDFENKGIAENTNTCIQLASGDYIALLDHDDVLHPSACYFVARAIEDQKADFIYTDETKFRENEREQKIIDRPYYKPDFSAEELRCHNYICHFNAYKRTLFDEVGGYRPAFDGSQDHDMVLRLTEKAQKIVHIRRVLYYWRVHENSVAINISAKPYATIAGINAVNEQLKRIGDQTEVRSTYNSIPRYRYNVSPVAETISLVFWDVKNIKELLRTYDWVLSDLVGEKNIGSIAVMGRRGITEDICKAKSLIPFEISNISEIYADDIERYNKTFSDQVSEINKTALEEFLKAASGDFTWIIKSGIEPITKNISGELMAYVRHKSVACAEGKIIYSDNAVMSGGVICDDRLIPRLQLRCEGKISEFGGYEDMMLHTRRVSGITGICAMVDNKEFLTILQGADRTNGDELEPKECLSTNGKSSETNTYRNVNPIIEATVASSKGLPDEDLECIWTCNVIVRGDLRGYKAKIYAANYDKNCMLSEDLYFNYNIVKYGLE